MNWTCITRYELRCTDWPITGGRTTGKSKPSACTEPSSLCLSSYILPAFSTTPNPFPFTQAYSWGYSGNYKNILPCATISSRHFWFGKTLKNPKPTNRWHRSNVWMSHCKWNATEHDSTFPLYIVFSGNNKGTKRTLKKVHFFIWVEVNLKQKKLIHYIVTFGKLIGDKSIHKQLIFFVTMVTIPDLSNHSGQYSQKIIRFCIPDF